MPLSPRPHLDVRQWLNVLDLGEYASVFEKFEGVEVSYGQQHLSAHPTVIEDYFLSSRPINVFLFLIYVNFLPLESLS